MSRDDGAAVVDFALVGALLTVLFVAVLQIGVVVHVKNTLVDCAAEGARLGARSDRTPDDGVERTRELVASELSGGYAARLADQISATGAERAGVQVVEVRIRAPLPVLGLAGPSGWLTVRGSAFDERQ